MHNSPSTCRKKVSGRGSRNVWAVYIALSIIMWCGGRMCACIANTKHKCTTYNENNTRWLVEQYFFSTTISTFCFDFLDETLTLPLQNGMLLVWRTLASYLLSHFRLSSFEPLLHSHHIATLASMSGWQRMDSWFGWLMEKKGGIVCVKDRAPSMARQLPPLSLSCFGCCFHRFYFCCCRCCRCCCPHSVCNFWVFDLAAEYSHKTISKMLTNWMSKQSNSHAYSKPLELWRNCAHECQIYKY